MEFRISVIICLIIIKVGGTLFLIGFSTKYWLSVGGSIPNNMGLWEGCGAHLYTGKKLCIPLEDLPADSPYYKIKVKALQAVMCVGLLFYIFSIMLHLHLLFVEKVKETQTIGWIASTCAALFIFIGLVIFGNEYGARIGIGKSKWGSAWDYSFYLTVIADFLAVIDAILVAKVIKTEQKTIIVV